MIKHDFGEDIFDWISMTSLADADAGYEVELSPSTNKRRHRHVRYPQWLEGLPPKAVE